MTQLLYRSRSLIGDGSVLQMSGILSEARPANARDNITGALTCVGGSFVQVLEGPAKAIDNLMERLGRDRRHTDIIVLDRRTVNQRAFGDWDLVSPRLAGLELTAMKAGLDDGSADLDQVIGLFQAAVFRQASVLDGWSRTQQADSRRAESAGAQEVPTTPN